MKTFLYNIGYFFLEAKRTIRFNPLSNLFSVVGTGLILFLFGMVIAGWSIGDQMISALQGEAEISAYFDTAIDKEAALGLADTIKGMDGVYDAKYVNETEARTQMKEMLGEEAEILELFEENPFEAFLEVRINLENMDTVLANIQTLEGINYVRDNREILEQMKSITEGIKLLGSLIILAVGITTVIIIAHMIREGIYNNKDQINTLRLLGAPSTFIGFPFVLAGLLLTVFGGVIAAILLIILINNGYGILGGSIPFIPLPPMAELRQNVCVIIIGVSVILGLLGSLFGLSSIHRQDNKG
ncbi:MAG: permease-like cell division protein FtsX [Mobilitalea sp.]